MSATDHAQILAAIEGIRDKDEVSLLDILLLAETSIRSTRAFFDGIDRAVYREFHEIATYIERAKAEIGQLQANELKENRLPSAGRELHAVIDATEDATTRIMESAEAILAADPSDHDAYRAAVQDNVMAIFEACSFQDITGQRIAKVVETLEFIERRVDRFLDAVGAEDVVHISDDEEKRDSRKRDLLLNGPALEGEGHAQSAIDALMES